MGHLLRLVDAGYTPSVLSVLPTIE
jgi:hypothetical protein